MAQIAKTVDPEITGILGGVHPSVQARRVLRCADIDVAVIGDLVLKQLVRAAPK